MKAALQGEQTSQLRIAQYSEQGDGCVQSLGQAIEFYSKAAEQGGDIRAICKKKLERAVASCPLLNQRVVLRGLNAQALNGTCGRAVDFAFSERVADGHPDAGQWAVETGRYTVRLADGSLVKVKGKNLAAAPPPGVG